MGVAMALPLSGGGGAPSAVHSGDMNDPSIREMARTPVNALSDQFQNGMYLHDAGSGAGSGSYHRNMNRSRSPGRELDSQPQQQHSVRFFFYFNNSGIFTKYPNSGIFRKYFSILEFLCNIQIPEFYEIFFNSGIFIKYHNSGLF